VKERKSQMNDKFLKYVLAVLLGVSMIGCGGDKKSSTPEEEGTDGTDGTDGPEGTDRERDTGTGDCALGSEGCACREGNACNDGLVCLEGICQEEDIVPVEVTDENARACEVLLLDNDARVIGVDFSDNVKGTFVIETPKTAVAFIAKEDVPFQEGDLVVRMADADAETAEVGKVVCFDGDGRPLQDVEINLR
jgi:hypothetical protein